MTDTNPCSYHKVEVRGGRHLGVVYKGILTIEGFYVGCNPFSLLTTVAIRTLPIIHGIPLLVTPQRDGKSENTLDQGCIL